VILGSDRLARQFLHANFFYEEYLFVPFRDLMLGLLRQEQSRALAGSVLVSFLNSSSAQSLVVQGFTDFLASDFAGAKLRDSKDN